MDSFKAQLLKINILFQGCSLFRHRFVQCACQLQGEATSNKQAKWSVSRRSYII